MELMLGVKFTVEELLNVQKTIKQTRTRTKNKLIIILYCLLWAESIWGTYSQLP